MSYGPTFGVACEKWCLLYARVFMLILNNDHRIMLPLVLHNIYNYVTEQQ